MLLIPLLYRLNILFLLLKLFFELIGEIQHCLMIKSCSILILR
jgi:hypothetical protein